ncbi:hypothetical protein CLV53_1463 [Sediminibacterium magnilacihabitans]|jgi:hypothetical protein|nr:hypothetical protein CLV53_1463 [Sediminibacterium magnilacihabitans]
MTHNQQLENGQSVNQGLTVTDQQSTLNEFFADGSAGYTKNGEGWISGMAVIKYPESLGSTPNRKKEDECVTGEDLLKLTRCAIKKC